VAAAANPPPHARWAWAAHAPPFAGATGLVTGFGQTITGMCFARARRVTPS